MLIKRNWLSIFSLLQYTMPQYSKLQNNIDYSFFWHIEFCFDFCPRGQCLTTFSFFSWWDFWSKAMRLTNRRESMWTPGWTIHYGKIISKTGLIVSWAIIICKVLRYSWRWYSMHPPSRAASAVRQGRGETHIHTRKRGGVAWGRGLCLSGSLLTSVSSTVPGTKQILNKYVWINKWLHQKRRPYI